MVVKKPRTRDGFDPPLTLTPDILSPARETLRLDGRLDKGILSPALHRILLGMARLRNIVSSLQIEEGDIDLAQARQALDTGDATTPKQEEVLRFSEAYAELDDADKAPELTVETILAYHERFFQGLVDEPVGELKTEPNGVRDRASGAWVFHATPPDETRAELESLLEWYRRDAVEFPPAVAAALFFVEFEAIHPFHDGNGRLGRFLNLVALKHFGLKNACLVPIDGRFFRTQDNYYDALRATNAGKNYHVWVRYYVQELRRAYEIADQRADLSDLVDDYSRQSTRTLLEWILTGDGGWFGRSDYPNPGNYADTTVSASLRELVEDDVLETKGRTKGRKYRLHPDFLRSLYNADLVDPG